MNNCKICNTSFKFCSSCKFTENSFAKSMGYCCGRCLRVDYPIEDFMDSEDKEYQIWVLNNFKEEV